MRRHTDDQIKNRELPELEDWRQDGRGEGAYAIHHLEKEHKHKPKPCMMMYRTCMQTIQRRKADKIKLALPSDVEFDSIAGNVSQVLGFTSSCGSIEPTRSLLNHLGVQSESASNTQAPYTASVTMAEPRESMMKEHDTKEQKKENNVTTLKQVPCQQDTKSPPIATTGSETEPCTHQSSPIERIVAEMVPGPGKFLDLTIDNKYFFVKAP